MKADSEVPTTGFFVDEDGKTRDIENPGRHLTCRVWDCGGFFGVDLLDSEGFCIHQADYHPDLASIEARGVEVVMHQEPRADRRLQPR